MAMRAPPGSGMFEFNFWSVFTCVLRMLIVVGNQTGRVARQDAAVMYRTDPGVAEAAGMGSGMGLGGAFQGDVGAQAFGGGQAFSSGAQGFGGPGQTFSGGGQGFSSGANSTCEFLFPFHEVMS